MMTTTCSLRCRFRMKLERRLRIPCLNLLAPPLGLPGVPGRVGRPELKFASINPNSISPPRTIPATTQIRRWYPWRNWPSAVLPVCSTLDSSSWLISDFFRFSGRWAANSPSRDSIGSYTALHSFSFTFNISCCSLYSAETLPGCEFEASPWLAWMEVYPARDNCCGGVSDTSYPAARC